jgi:hypothetical protein
MPRSTPRRPAFGAIVMGLIPFTAICFSVPLWDRVHPTVFGLPFNLVWLVSWMALTPLCMTVAYRIESGRAPETDENPRR